MSALAVIIPTHDPDPDRLKETLLGLKSQSYQGGEYLIINNSSTRFPGPTFLAEYAPANTRVVDEPVLGLTAARRRGFAATSAELFVLVDDDNVLSPDYLEHVARIFIAHADIGAIGGRSHPRFEKVPDPWMAEFFPLLALRDLGSTSMISTGLRPPGAVCNQYPACAPIGAGMALRRSAIARWLEAPSAISDRRGTALTSAGDNDLVFSVMKAGWRVGYFPELVLTHLIPATRLDPEYLGRLNAGIQESWMRVLRQHEATPWQTLSPAGARMRQVKAWFTLRAWQSPAARIRWRGACGHFAGRVR